MIPTLLDSLGTLTRKVTAVVGMEKLVGAIMVGCCSGEGEVVHSAEEVVSSVGA